MSLTEALDLFGPEFHYTTTHEGKRFAVHQTLATNLLLKLHWSKKYQGDLVIFIDGKEGTGKSTLARQVAKLLDPTFDHTRIVYDKRSCINLFFKLPEWSAILLDESQQGLDRRSSMSRENKDWNAFMRQSRQAHKILIMAGPSIYDIDSYVSEHRVTFLLHCYLRRGLHVGYYSFYNSLGIKKLFLYGKKSREYSVVTPRFRGPFSNNDTCDMENYALQKKAAFDKFKQYEVPDRRSEEEIIRDFKKGRIAKWEELCSICPTLRPVHVKTLFGESPKTLKDWARSVGVDFKSIHGRSGIPKEHLVDSTQ